MTSDASRNELESSKANQSPEQSPEEFTQEPANAPKQSLLLGAGLITVGFLANTVQGALGKLAQAAPQAALQAALQTTGQAIGQTTGQTALQVTAQAALGPGQFLWLLLLLALAVLIPVEVFRRGRDLRQGVAVFPFLLLRAVFGLCGFYLFIWAAGLGSLVNANVLLNTTPVFIPIISAIALKKQISLRLWGAIALGFVGLVLVVQPNAQLLRNPANLIGLGAGLCAAMEFLTVRSLSKTQSPLGQTLYYLLIGSVLIAPVALWQWQPLTLPTLGYVIAAAGAFLMFQLLLVQAYRYAEPHQIGVFQYSSVIFAALIGWLFFDEIPNRVAIAGMILISMGGAIAIYLEQKPQLQKIETETETAVQ
jgi:drug/metabolite transporter (DMT)-like permease